MQDERDTLGSVVPICVERYWKEKRPSRFVTGTCDSSLLAPWWITVVLPSLPEFCLVAAWVLSLPFVVMADADCHKHLFPLM